MIDHHSMICCHMLLLWVFVSASLCKAVELTGVVREHLINKDAGYILPRPHVAKNLWLPGWVAATPTAAVMAPVRAHDQVVLSHVSHQIGQVFPLFVGRIETILLKQLWPPLLWTATEDTAQRVQHIGHPGGAGLDEAEAQRREEFGDFVGDDVAKGHQGQGAGMGEGVAAADIENSRERRTPGTRVHTDR